MVKTLGPAAFAHSAARDRITSSAIRDLLVVAERPDVISLAGGLPAPASFPAARIAEASAAVLAAEATAAKALQYSTSAGLEALRAWIADDRGGAPAFRADDVVVTAGSQQALDLVARALLDPGDAVVLADPGYVGAIQAFRLAGAELVPVPADGDGLRVDLLAEGLARGELRVPTLVYVVANFSNPGGATLSAERRRRLAALADRYGFVVVDDDPYGELRWGGERLEQLAALSDRVITLGSFSKVLAPGLRVGYAAGPPSLIEGLVLLKQAADLHTSTFGQHLALAVAADHAFWEGHLAALRRLYRERATALLDSLRARLGDRIEVDDVDGGLFVWARLPGVDTSALLPRAIDAGVAFVPGAAFAVREGAHHDAVRLSFATAEPAVLDEGVRRLAGALGEPAA
jgi:2-aminoadipate transaminase